MEAQILNRLSIRIVTTHSNVTTKEKKVSLDNKETYSQIFIDSLT